MYCVASDSFIGSIWGESEPQQPQQVQWPQPQQQQQEQQQQQQPAASTANQEGGRMLYASPLKPLNPKRPPRNLATSLPPLLLGQGFGL